MLNQCLAVSKRAISFLSFPESLPVQSWVWDSHSSRSAIIESTLIARRAGTYAASAATAARTIVTDASVSGSLADTPKSKWPSTREAASALIPARKSPAEIRISVSHETRKWNPELCRLRDFREEWKTRFRRRDSDNRKSALLHINSASNYLEVAAQRRAPIAPLEPHPRGLIPASSFLDRHLEVGA